MIQIIHMVLKNKLIKKTYHSRRFISPTCHQRTFITLTLKIRLGNISVENVRRLWICLGGMAEKTIFAAFIITYFLNRTTVDMPCPVMDGAYFITVFSYTLI